MTFDCNGIPMFRHFLGRLPWGGKKRAHPVESLERGERIRLQEEKYTDQCMSRNDGLLMLRI